MKIRSNNTNDPPSLLNTTQLHFPRKILIFTLLLIISLLLVSDVFADQVVNNIDNTIDSASESRTINAGGSTVVGFYINQTNNIPTGDPPQCSANGSGNAVTVNLSVPSGVTASVTALTFTNCGVIQNVTFSSTIPGSYGISIASVTGGRSGSLWDTSTANWTLVVNNTPPTLTVPASFSVEGNTLGGAVATYMATASDITDGVLTPTCLPASGSTFPVGVNPVNCSVTDSNGATTNASFNITVTDTTKPSIAAHGNEVAEATSAAGAVVNYTLPATSDIVDGAGTANCAPLPGSTFPLGVTTVYCNKADTAGNFATPVNFTVTVQDTTAPVIAFHEDITVEASSASGASVFYIPPATSDAVGGAGTATCLPATGSTFALGDTTVNCTAEDAAGNDAIPTSFVIHVVDTTAPSISGTPDDIVAEASSSSGAVVSYANPTANDLVDGTVGVVCSPASGSTFGLGVTTVSCAATDAHNNTATTSFTVTVQDTTAPVLTVPADFTVEGNTLNGAIVSFSRSASDTVAGTVEVACEPESDDFFPLGETEVTCLAVDNFSNVGSASFTVTVVDTTAPVIASHGDELAEATSADGAVVNYILPATSDAVDGAGTASCAPASGSTFPLGETIVTCNASDVAGNVATPTTFTVTVVDTTAPVIAAHPNVTAEATSADGAVVNYTSPATSDAVDGAGTASCAPASGSTFPLGETIVTCNASDVAGNVATPTTFTVTVVDTTAPTITCPANVAAYVGQAILLGTPTGVADAVDSTPTVTNNAPVTFPLGTTTVVWTVKDDANNTRTCNQTVTVTYNFTGFFSPVDNMPTRNVVKAGSSVPVKFRLGGNQGLNVFATDYPRSAQATCAGSLPTDYIEETSTAGSSGLTYDATTNQYTYVWKTDKKWAGSCRVLRVMFVDGTYYDAYFEFKK